MIRNKLSLWLLFGCCLFVIQSCLQETARVDRPRNVVLTQVSSLSSENSTNYPGVVEEGASVNAAFMADGKIGSLTVDVGDRVRKGQLLASLDDTDYRIGISQLEAQLNQMTKEKVRMDSMYARRFIAPNDYEKFEAGYEQLKLQLDMAKRKQDYTNLYSPSNGYIAAKNMNPGELVGAGTPVYTIVDDSKLNVSVDLPVSVYLNKNKIRSAKGKVPGVAGDIPLSIVSFTPVTDNNMLYRMKLSIPSSFAKELTSGMNISVWLSASENTNAESLIPSRAIFAEEGKKYVWIYNFNDSTIHKKEVSVIGAPRDDMSMVKGLSYGENIVETGAKQLFEGEKVNVLNRNELGI